MKPIFTHGLDVAEVPGIAGWLDKLLAQVFEQTLVEPNMLVVDVEKFASPQPENWFSINEKDPIAYALVEVIEGADMKPSDLNGLADPYVKGQIGPYRFRTKTQWKTLAPKWHEEFKVPICTWESPIALAIEVRDKDQFRDDTLGDCSVNISGLRGGERHDLWLPLRNIKMGRLHLAITVDEGIKKAPDLLCDTSNDENKRNSTANECAQKVSLLLGDSEKSSNVADKFEPIDIEGKNETGIWVHHPGREVPQFWEPRKGRSRVLDSQIRGSGGNLESPSAPGSYNNDNNSTDGSQEGKKGISTKNKVFRGLKKIGTLFSKNSKNEDMFSRTDGQIHSPHPNLKAITAKKGHVKLIVDEKMLSAPTPVDVPISEGKVSPETSSQESPRKKHVKDKAKDIFKNAGKSARVVKHAFNRKGPKESQGDSGMVVTKSDISVRAESSDGESLASSVCNSEGNPAIPKALSSCRNDSFKSEELHDPNAPFDFPIKKDSLEGTEKISFAGQGDEKIGDDYPSTMSVESNDLLTKGSSNSKRQEDLEVDKKEDFSIVESRNLDSGGSVV